MTIEHRKGSLFDAPAGALLAHACNAKGVWGSGIAKQFAIRFPGNYDAYHWYCHSSSMALRPQGIVGTTQLSWVERPNLEQWAGIACLITSKSYGKDVDSPEEILVNTRRAFTHLLLQYKVGPVPEIHMPRINSGLFGVPWEHTQAVLEGCLVGFSVKVIVWTP